MPRRPGLDVGFVLFHFTFLFYYFFIFFERRLPLAPVTVKHNSFNYL